MSHKINFFTDIGGGTILYKELAGQEPCIFHWKVQNLLPSDKRLQDTGLETCPWSRTDSCSSPLVRPVQLGRKK